MTRPILDGRNIIIWAKGTILSSDFNPQDYWEKVNSARRDQEYLRDFYRDISAQHYPTKEHEARGHQLLWMKDKIDSNGWSRLLDAGCGPGFWFQLWSELGIDAVGVDRAESAMPRARAMADAIGANIDVHCTPLSRLPFGDNAVDVTVTVKVLLHTPPDDIEETIAELGRISKNLMLLELQGVRPIETREHVFQHDYRKIIDNLGFEILTDELHQGNQQFMVVRTG